MINFLIKRFTKKADNASEIEIRESYGILSSITGIICNIILFLVKYIIGSLSNSISIISDAFNNLSDTGGCIVTLFGYKMAAKPADKDHPFGHGRAEYLTSFILAVIIILVGFELMRNSIEKIIDPEHLSFSVTALVSLILSIGLKLWMSIFNIKLGKQIKSKVMIATAKDSQNDMIATSAAVVALIASIFTDFPIDGIMGIFVSIFILKTGLEIVKDTVDDLLGKPVDLELNEKIKQIVLCNEKIIGVHDLLIHNYGPGNMIGSCHAEVRSDEDFVSIHDLIDRIERDIHEKLNIFMTIHMDPIEVDNENVNLCKKKVINILNNIDIRFHIHDFRAVIGDTHINLIFDLVVPYDCDFSDKEIKNKLDAELEKETLKYYTIITFDREY